MFFDDGGAFAHRRRDASNLFELSCLYTAFHNLLVSFCHLPDHHRALPLTSFKVVEDLLITLSRVSSLRWSSNLLAVVDEPYSALMLARSLKSKFASTLEPELNLTPASRSMESSCFTILVDQRPHQNSETLESVVKMAAEGLTLIHQASSVPVPSTTLPRWHCSSPFLPALMPQPPGKSQSLPITSLSLPSRHRVIYKASSFQSRENYGFSYWVLSNSAYYASHLGPTPTSTRLRTSRAGKNQGFEIVINVTMSFDRDYLLTFRG